MSIPKAVKLYVAEAKGELMRWHNKRVDLIEKGIIHKAIVPNDYVERTAMAKRCAALHARRNPSDPFAAMRGYSAVMNGHHNEEDFNSGNISLGC